MDEGKAHHGTVPSSAPEEETPWGGATRGGCRGPSRAARRASQKQDSNREQNSAADSAGGERNGRQGRGVGGVERKEKRKKPREEEEMDQVGTKAPGYCLLQGHTPQPHSAAPTPTRPNAAQPAHHFTASGPSRIQTVADSKDRQRVKISPSAGHTVRRAEQRGKFSITGHLNH